MELTLIAALLALILGVFIYAVLTQKALLAQMERDRRSLDTARAQLLALKSPEAASVAASVQRSTAADEIEQMLRESGGRLNSVDPDEGAYG